jgi:hypothetical protein
MDEKDLLEILATAAVADLARQIRNRHVEEEEARTGKRISPSQWPRVDDFFEEAVKMMQRRRARVIELLKP